MCPLLIIDEGWLLPTNAHVPALPRLFDTHLLKSTSSGGKRRQQQSTINGSSPTKWRQRVWTKHMNSSQILRKWKLRSMTNFTSGTLFWIILILFTSLTHTRTSGEPWLTRKSRERLQNPATEIIEHPQHFYKGLRNICAHPATRHGQRRRDISKLHSLARYN